MLKRNFIFAICCIVLFSAAVVRGQGSTQRTVGITNANGNTITIQSGVGTSAYTLTLPLTINPSPTTYSLLIANGTGSLAWTPTAGVTPGYVLSVQPSGPNLVPSFVDPATLFGANYVNYNTATPQNLSLDRSNYLFNVSYGLAAPDADAIGAMITSTAGITDRNATGLSIVSTASGIGTATGLNVSATGGTTSTAIAATGNINTVGNLNTTGNVVTTGNVNTTGNVVTTGNVNTTGNLNTTGNENTTGNINILSSAGIAHSLSLQDAPGLFTSSFTAGAQTQNISYTLPIAPPAFNGQMLAVTTTGTMSWVTVTGAPGTEWLTTGNSGLTDNASNYIGTLDNVPLRFVAGSSGSPNTRMLLDISGNLLFGSGASASSFTTGSGRLAFGDALTTARLNSVPSIGTNVFNMIDANAGLRVWRFATNAGNNDPAIDLIGGTNDNQDNSANQWWTISSTGTPGSAGSGTNATGEHMSFRRRSGATDSEYVAIFTGGNVGIGTNSAGYVPTPSTKLTVLATDTVTSSAIDVLSLQHNSTATPTTSFGTGLVFQGQSSTTQNRNIAKIQGVWTDASDASRSGALTFSTDSVGVDREKLRIAANGYVGFNNTSPEIRADINGGYATRSTTVNLTNGNTNHNIPVGDCAFLRIVGPTAPFTITGLQAGVDGQRLRIANITGKDMTIADSSSLSTLGNRIETNTNSDIIVKGPVPILDMTYDGTTSQWLLGTLNANQIVGGVGSILYVYKTSDESVGNNTTGATLQDDDHLQFTVAAGQTWEVNGEIDVRCTSTTPDMKMGFTLPSGATMKVMYTGIQDANGNAIMGNGQMLTSGTGYVCTLDNTNATLITFRGIVRTSAAGTLQFQWSQNTGSTANPVTIKTDSYMKLIRIQ